MHKIHEENSLWQHKFHWTFFVCRVECFSLSLMLILCTGEGQLKFKHKIISFYLIAMKNSREFYLRAFAEKCFCNLCNKNVCELKWKILESHQNCRLRLLWKMNVENDLCARTFQYWYKRVEKCWMQTMELKIVSTSFVNVGNYSKLKKFF